ncbi:MAG: TonB-dependent receptor, partial [Beijerinckiaceae bacterium]|nr:TonB-dependent receptor [Beijerinckiaceae bacterium]
ADTYFDPYASTAAKIDVPIIEFPQSIQIVTQEVINDQNPEKSLADLSRNVSGVFVNQSGGFGVNAPVFTIRGFDNAGQVLRDGIPRSTFSQPIDLAGIDRVEFLKGPTSALYGTTVGSFGGIVNFITKVPTATPFFSATGVGGSFGFLRATVDINTPLNDEKTVLMRLNAAEEKADDVQKFVNHTESFVSGALAWTLDNGDRVTLNGDYTTIHGVQKKGIPLQEQDVFPDDPQIPVFLRGASAPGILWQNLVLLSLPRSFYPGLPSFDRFATTSANLDLRYRHDFDNNWNVEAIADYNRQGFYFGSRDFGFYQFPTIFFGHPSFGLTNNRNDNLIFQINLRGKFNTWFLKHNALFGVERQMLHGRFFDWFAFNDLGSINIFRPGYPGGFIIEGPLYDNGANFNAINAVYGQDLIELHPQLKMLIGARADYLRSSSFFRDASNFDPEVNISDKQSDRALSPRAGVLYLPNQDLSFYGSWGQSFTPNAGIRLAGNVLPPPEIAQQYELGMKHLLFDGKAFLNVAIYDITRNNVAVQLPNSQFSVISGQQHSKGLEIDLNGEVFPNFRMTAAATLNQAIVSKSEVPFVVGSTLLGAPHHIFNFWGVYSFQDELKGLEFGAGYYYAGATQATGVFVPNTFTLSPVQSLSAMVAYNFNDNWRFQFNAKNITDRPNFVSNGALLPGQPRSFFVTLTGKI